MHKKFATTGKTVINGQIVDGQVELSYPDSSETGGIGNFVDKKAYDIYMQGTYQGEFNTLEAGGTPSTERVVFHIGKTALLLLLAQPGTEGIRLTKINYQGKESFIVESLSSEIVFVDGQQRKFNKALKAKAGIEPTVVEDIYGFTIADLYKELKPKQSPPVDFTFFEFANLI
ncbi:MAG: hypothetical protein JNM88_20255 [Chitinophagaceae bacterium]|nr:hypothetical protein [Chitinophagaceae bacterium]